MMKSKLRATIEQFRAGHLTCAILKREVVGGGEKDLVSVANLRRRDSDSNGREVSSINLTRHEVALAISILKQAFDKMTDGKIEQDIAKAMAFLKGGSLPRTVHRRV